MKLRLLPPTLCVFLTAAIHAGTAISERESAPLITLEQAYDRALASDQSIRIAYWEVRKANLLPWSALAKLGPQLTGNANFSHREQTTTRNSASSAFVSGDNVIVSGITSRSRTESGSTGLSLQQPLIDFSVFPAYYLGKLSAQAARLEHRFTIRGILFGVTQAYYEVLKQQQLITVNRQALDLANEQLDLAKKRANVGEVTRVDVLRAQVTVETARRTLVESENTLALDRNTLANILNLPPDSAYRVMEPAEYPTDVPSFGNLLLQAYAHREDLLVSNIGIDQDMARRNEIVAEYAPRLVAQANAQHQSSSGSNSSRNNSWDTALSVSIPFFTGGQREIDLTNAGYQISESRLNRDKTAKQVEADVKQAWLNVDTLAQTLRALRIQVQAAQEAYKDVQTQYGAGTATSVDVLSALNDLNNSRKDLAVQIYDYQVALRNLEQASGVFQEQRVQRAKLP